MRHHSLVTLFKAGIDPDILTAGINYFDRA